MSQSISPEEIFELMTAKPCYVYCVRAEEYSSSVKIGISENLTQRIRQLDSTAHPLTYYFSHIRKFQNRDEAFKFEQDLLNVFGHLRGKGEWLRVDDSLDDYIQKNLDKYTDYKLLEISESFRAKIAREIEELSIEYIKEILKISPVKAKDCDRAAILSQFFYLVFIRHLIIDTAKTWDAFYYFLKSFELAEIGQELIHNAVGKHKPQQLAILAKLKQDEHYIDSSTRYTERWKVMMGDGSHFEVSNEFGEVEFIKLMTKVTEGYLSLNQIDADDYNSPKLYDLIWSLAAPDHYPYVWRRT